MLIMRLAMVAAIGAMAVFEGFPWRAEAQPNNVVIFVADGLRSRIVDERTAPALAAVRDEGVDFRNSHSLFPTLTTPNASAIATGHQLGDTGDFGNSLYIGNPFGPPYGGVTLAMEDDVGLGLLNQRFGGNYLHETSLLSAARASGFSTAAIGKLGPTAIQDVEAMRGGAGIVIDDETGFPSGQGVRLSPDLASAMKAAGIVARAPDRGLNTWPGAYNMPGVRVANTEQQDWFVAVTTKVVLPRFKLSGKPFVLMFWSRDPDGTQHNQGDSLNSLTPGIDGPTSMAAIRNASDDLQALREALRVLGLERTTNIVVTADHGFATLSRESSTSAAAKMRFADVVPGFLPPGFLAIDMARALKLEVFEPTGVRVDDGFYPSRRDAVLGADPDHPQIVVASNGGSDLIYLLGADIRALAARVVKFMTEEDYTGAIFVRDDLGPIAGALPTSEIGLSGATPIPTPAIVVSFRSFSTGCADPENCGAEVADTDLQQGQGTHGSFGRQDTHNFMAAIGPDFKTRFVDPSPVSNADLAITLAKILGIDLPAHGHAMGRVVGEALTIGGNPVPATRRTIRSAASANGFITALDLQEEGGVRYSDAAGTAGRTLGLRP